jgi:hypothetical protein
MADETKDLVSTTLMQQVVALSLTGTPEYKIAESLGISRYAVKKMREGEEFKTALKEIGEKASALALNQFKAKLEELAPLAFEALKHNLKEKKLDAVRVFAEAAGIKNQVPEAQQDSSITILMPGAQPIVKDIPAEGRNVSEE